MFFKIMALIGVMAVGTFVSTKLQSVDMPHCKSLSGDWGDMPETSALVSMHLVWFFLVVPPMAFAVFSFPSLRRRRIWLVVAVVLLLVVAGLLRYDTLQFMEENPDAELENRFFAFSLARYIDYPVLALFVGSVISFGLSWCLRAKNNTAEESLETQD